MEADRAVVIDGDLHELLIMLAVNRNQSAEETVARLIEAEFDRIHPGMLEDIRRPGAAIKRLYAATGRPVPLAFQEAVEPEFGRVPALREFDETGEIARP